MQPTIFLVDDDPDDIDTFCEALSLVTDKVECWPVSSGVNAVRDLKNLHGKVLPVVIFLDVNMPEVNGWEVLEKLKSDKELNHIPVVMYSTSSFNTSIEKALRLGAECFYTKPRSFEKIKDMVAVITQHIEQGDMTNLCKNLHKN